MSYSFTAASSQYLSTATAPVSAAPCTISVWVKPSDTGANRREVASICAANATDYFSYNRFAGALYVNGADSGGESNVNTAEVMDTEWAHSAAVYTSPTSRQVYYEGTSSAVDSNSKTPVGLTRFVLGALGWPSPAAFWDGLLAEVAIWNVALSGANITSLSEGSSPMSLATPPLRYWRLKSSGDLTDVVGGAATLTATGATFDADHPTVDDPPSTARLLALTGVG